MRLPDSVWALSIIGASLGSMALAGIILWQVMLTLKGLGL